MDSPTPSPGTSAPGTSPPGTSPPGTSASGTSAPGTSTGTSLGPALTAAQLQAVLALRAAVFVVEQDCPYLDVDGRDLDAGTWHAWTADADGGVLACLRVLTEAGGERRIGRVCTAKPARGAGHAARLMAAALDHIGDAPSVLDAQSYARAFYERFGYVVAGAEFLDDGIPHLPMRRSGTHQSRPPRDPTRSGLDSPP